MYVDSTDNFKKASHDDLILVEKAVLGDPSAKEAITQVVHSVIQTQTKIFCKRFCGRLYIHYKCTLVPEWSRKAKDIPLCEWGNHSYAWMLEDLCSPDRLARFSGKNGARLTTYFFTIINSVAFYERWKDWRFGRQIRVPSFIRDISPVADQCFRLLYDGVSPEIISQKTGWSLQEIEKILDKIIKELTVRGKLHYLNKHTLVPLVISNAEDEDEETQKDIPDNSWDPVQEQLCKKVKAGWDQLTPIEQFILEAMVIEEREAGDILAALLQMKISIKDGVSPEEIDRQQLYYFKRVTLAKLARSSGLV